MKHFQFLYQFAFIILLVSLINAQNPDDTAIALTLPNAIERSLTNHHSPRIQKAVIEQARGQLTSAGVLPNPVLSYYREDLSLGGLESGEWSIAGQLPLNFMWERWPTASAAAARIEAEEARLDDIERLLTFEVKRAFSEYNHAQQIHEAWQHGMTILKEVSLASQARLTEGDVSGYENQRIAVELRRYEKHTTDAAAERSTKKGYLAYLIDARELHGNFETIAPHKISVPAIFLEDINAMALAGRPDLNAAQAFLESSQAMLTTAKRQALPATSFSVGYKEQQDNFSGLVMQLNVGIPLFDRNQGKVQETKAVMQGQVVQSESLKKQVLLEVRNAYDRFKIYQRQYEKIEQESTFSPEKLLRIARLSYQEGEIPLIQLLDAVRAYVETLQIQEDLVLQYYLSFYELEKVTATALAEY